MGGRLWRGLPCRAYARPLECCRMAAHAWWHPTNNKPSDSYSMNVVSLAPKTASSHSGSLPALTCPQTLFDMIVLSGVEPPPSHVAYLVPEPCAHANPFGTAVLFAQFSWPPISLFRWRLVIQGVVMNKITRMPLQTPCLHAHLSHVALAPCSLFNDTSTTSPTVNLHPAFVSPVNLALLQSSRGRFLAIQPFTGERPKAWNSSCESSL